MLYIVRHGQTELNLKRLFCGRTDCALTAVGEEQARQTGKKLSAIPFDAVISSPMIRARRTAELILSENENKSEIIIENDLIERDFGELEGTPIVDISYYRKDYDAEKYGIETLDAVKARIFPLIERIKSEYQGKTVLIVAHNAVIRIIRLALGEGEGLDDLFCLGIDNAEVLSYPL